MLLAVPGQSYAIASTRKSYEVLVRPRFLNQIPRHSPHWRDIAAIQSLEFLQIPRISQIFSIVTKLFTMTLKGN